MPRFISNIEKAIKNWFGSFSKGDGDPMSLEGTVFGLPPSTHISDEVIINSMPVATIIPCEPEFSKGSSLFTLQQAKGWEKHKEILKSVGFTMGNTRKAVKVAYIVDSFPTDVFNNEYGETIFDRMAQGVSSSVGDFSQILGLTDAKDLKKIVSKTPVIGGAANTVMNKGEDMYNGIIDAMEEGGHSQAASIAGTVKDSLVAAATGSRIDFPQVWKNSSFSPSYTMTIRLYNPNPGDPESTKRHIVGPIAAILALALPKVGGKNVSSYKWPLMCKIISPGIYNLNAGYISSVSIIKGGDQQNIAYNQALAMCDIRIEFGSLYNSMISGKGSNNYSDIRPTLGNYLEVIGGKKFGGENSVTVLAGNEKKIFDLKNPPANLYITPPAATFGDRIGSAAKATAAFLADASKTFIKTAKDYHAGAADRRDAYDKNKDAAS